MTDFEDKISCSAVTDDHRSEARLCVVQAVYEWRVGGEAITHVEADFLAGPVASRKASKKVFKALFATVTAENERFTGLISAYLKDGWTFARLDATLQALLLTAVAELASAADTPVKVIVTEYLTLTRLFFDENQVPFVNGILDSIARQLRPEEFVA